MDDDLNSVKTGYHHGDLRAALIAAAGELIETRGVDGFSLREAARRAGVSPAAPAHHFGSARGLLTAVAADAFRRFADALEAGAASGSTRSAQIRGMGEAYVRFALSFPGQFDLMWRRPLLDKEDPTFAAEGARAFDILDRAVRGADASSGGPGDPALAPSIAAWSIVHGFARLALEGAFGGSPDDAAEAAKHLLPRMLDHLDV